MAVIEMAERRRDQFREPARASHDDGDLGPEAAIFGVLIFVFAMTVGFVVQRDHRNASTAEIKTATVAHRVAAENPRPSLPLPSTRISTAFKDFSIKDAHAADISAATSNVVDSAARGIHTVVKTAWEPAVWASDQVLRYISDAWVNPLTGDRLFFNAAPGAFNLAVAILAFAMVALVMMALVTPLYASWKSWRVGRAHVFRYR